MTAGGAGPSGPGAQPPPPRRLLQTVRALSTPHTRKKAGLVLVEGWKLVREALGAGVPTRALLLRTGVSRDAADGLTALAGAAPIYEVDRAAFDDLAGTRQSQGVLALVEEPRPARAGLLSTEDPRPLALLCAVQEPQNVGAMLRTAAGLGFRGALLTRGTADPFVPKAVRASAGLCLRFPLARAGEPAAAVREVQAAGLCVVAAARPGTPLRDWNPGPGPWALAVGNEGQGLDPEASALAEARVWIDLAPAVESLNAAVAFGILAHRLRAAPPPPPARTTPAARPRQPLKGVVEG